MKRRTVDKTKKSNIKCEHCKFWQFEKQEGAWVDGSALKVCTHSKEPKYYWNRCKKFEWKEDE